MLAGCGSSGSSAGTSTRSAATKTVVAPAISGHTTVAIRNFMYAPMSVTVRAGTRVTFHNYDQTAHTATAIGGGFDTGTIQPGQSATVVLSKPGTYRYHCLFHAFMLATIHVVAQS
jgi:plastocyanin